MKASVIASLVTFLAASATAAPVDSITAGEFEVAITCTATNGSYYDLSIPANDTTVDISMLPFPLVTNAYTFRSKANK